MRILGDSKVTGKFQTTLPKSVRNVLELGSGDRVVFLVERGHVIIKKGKLEVQA